MQRRPENKPVEAASVALLLRSQAPVLDPALLPYLFAWLPAALLTLKIKYSIVSLLAARVISRSLGRVGDEALGPLEKLSLYSNDVWVAFLLVPAVWLLLLRFMPPRTRPYLAAGANLLLFLLLFASWQCFLQTGRYYSLFTLRDSLWWTWHHPEFVGQYLSLRAAVQLAAAGIGICIVSGWARIRERSRGGAEAPGKNILAGYALAVVLAALAPFLAANIPATPYHASVLVSVAGALTEQGGEALPLGQYTGLAPEELVERYRVLARAPEPVTDDRFFGRARGYNVLLFILETAPSRVLPIGGDLEDLPNLRALRRNAFVAEQHHSTYPYTDRAWFSILTSLYPSSLMRPASEIPGMNFPGMMRALTDRGYATKVYYTPFQHDETMFRSLGVQSQYLQQRMAKTGPGDDAVSLKLAADAATIEQVRKDLVSWDSEGRNFCIAIGPQIGHAPWPELPGKSTGNDLLSRGRATVRMQDAWLGELAELLRKQGRLHRTLIVVVGDHGVRTRQEDASFEGGMIDEYSFHVPMLIAAPGVLRGRQDIPWLTSHIDISPTVLDLLGVENGRSIEQGSPVWDRRLAERVTFFFANHYLGADGYVDRNEYFMKNHVAQTVYKNDRMRFDSSSIVPPGSAEHAAAADRISRMVALQEVLARTVGERGPHENSANGGGRRSALHPAPDRTLLMQMLAAKILSAPA